VVAGVALLLAFGRRGLIGQHLDAFGLQIPFTSIAVVMAQVFIASPFFVRAARAGFEAVDTALESAAQTLGASPWRVFWTITVPLARPALVAGTVLAWARSLSEFGATMMFAGNFPGRTQTLSLAVMSAMESDLDTALAISTLALGLGIVALVLAKRLAQRVGAS
jgi:molybdate transport system permease protein